jgi:putative transposase
MWTPAARVQPVRSTQPYATCLTNAAREIAQAFLTPAAACGRQRRWPMGALLDAMLYVLRTGCAWRHLPCDFPPWQAALRWFLHLARGGTFERMAHALALANLGTRS